MKNSTLWWLLLLFVVVVGVIEFFVIARWKTGVFDPRCLFLRGYVIAHSYEKGKPEEVRCLPDTP